VFTAWYSLSPYIEQIRFVFKGLKVGVARKCGQNESNIKVDTKILESSQKVGEWGSVD
jgi:hypothetical protein